MVWVGQDEQSQNERPQRPAALSLMHAARSALAGCIAALFTACGAGTPSELQIYDMQPRAGATAGDQPVQITANRFRRDIGYSVYFGSRRATQSTTMNDTTLVVLAPAAEQAGVVDVTIVADDGPAFRLKRAFHYQDQGGNVLEQVGKSAAQSDERF